MDCKICFEKFDTRSTMPIVCIPCGHCFCKRCVSHLTKCSICRTYIKDKKPNYGLLDVLDEEKHKYGKIEHHRHFKVEQHNEKRYEQRDIGKKLDRAIVVFAKNVAFN